MIIPIVVQVEHTVDLAVVAHMDVVHILHAFARRLPGVFLHLNVVEFPAARKNVNPLETRSCAILRAASQVQNLTRFSRGC